MNGVVKSHTDCTTWHIWEKALQKKSVSMIDGGKYTHIQMITWLYLYILYIKKLAPYPFVILSHIVHSIIIHSSIMHTFGIYMEVFMYINRRWVQTDIWSRCDRACCTFVYFPRVNNDWLALPTYLYYTSMS